MNEEQLDQIIDTAAARMVSGRPPQSLARAVMSRVRERGEESGPRRRFAYAAAALACLVFFVVVLNRPTAPPAKVAKTAEPGAPAPIATRAVQPQPRPIAEQTTVPVQRRRNRVTSMRPAVRPATVPVDAPWDESPIVVEPIIPEPIDVPVLQVGGFPIENIDIEPIVIEALAGSND